MEELITVRIVDFQTYYRELQQLENPVIERRTPKPLIRSNKSEFNHDPFFQKYLEDRDGICGKADKYIYTTKTQARNARRELQIRYKQNYRIYQCEYCNRWHLATVASKRDINK